MSKRGKSKNGQGTHNHCVLLSRFQIDLAIQKLLNSSMPSDFDELLFWGRISGVKNDYYIAMGIIYNDRFEFPEKRFFWCNASNGMTFEPFPDLNDQHRAQVDGFAGQMFQGSPNDVLITVEKAGDKEEAEKRAAEQAAKAQRDSL